MERGKCHGNFLIPRSQSVIILTRTCWSNLLSINVQLPLCNVKDVATSNLKLEIGESIFLP